MFSEGGGFFPLPGTGSTGSVAVLRTISAEMLQSLHHGLLGLILGNEIRHDSEFPEFGDGHGQETFIAQGKDISSIVEYDTGLEPGTCVPGKLLKPLGIPRADRLGELDFHAPHIRATRDCTIHFMLVLIPVVPESEPRIGPRALRYELLNNE